MSDAMGLVAGHWWYVFVMNQWNLFVTRLTRNGV